jgi:hypothetical protein
MKTNQELFNIMADHLLTQLALAMDEEGKNCMYRGMNGTKCAVGALISDETYRPTIESVGMYTVNIMGSNYAMNDKKKAMLECLTANGIENDSYPLLAAIQDVHDNAESCIKQEDLKEHWTDKLDRVCKRFNLEPSDKIKENQCL